MNYLYSFLTGFVHSPDLQVVAWSRNIDESVYMKHQHWKIMYVGSSSTSRSTLWMSSPEIDLHSWEFSDYFLSNELCHTSIDWILVFKDYFLRLYVCILVPTFVIDKIESIWVSFSTCPVFNTFPSQPLPLHHLYFYGPITLEEIISIIIFSQKIYFPLNSFLSRFISSLFLTLLPHLINNSSLSSGILPAGF